MDDLEFSKQQLKNKNRSLVFAKDSKVIFETNIEGLKGFLQAIETKGRELSNTSVADKIVGKAAALLCLYAKVKAVFAVTISQSGLEILEKSSLKIDYENLVQTILNLNRTDRCPFEKLVQKISNPSEAFERIRLFCSSKSTENL